jgi:hypothetical protein
MEDDSGSPLQRFKSMVSWVYGFLVCGDEEHYGREHMVEQTPHFIASEKKRTCFYNQAPSPIPFKPSSIK